MRTRHSFVPFPYREPRAARWLADLRYDLRYAVRQLTRAPALTALIVGTLAVGIGANAMMASVIDRLLFRYPPAVRDPGQLARLVFVSPLPSGAILTGSGAGYPFLLDIQRGVPAFEAAAGYMLARFSLGAGSEATFVHATLVTPGFFSLLGAPAYRGRFFGAADGYPTNGGEGGPPLAVLSYGFWQRQFAGNEAVLGRTIALGELTYTVVGVAPPGFRGIEAQAPDLWLPATVTAPVEIPMNWYAGRASPWLTLIARIRPGATRDAAAAQATVIRRRHPPAGAGADSLGRVVLAPAILGRGPDAPRQSRFVLWLGAVSVLVLLIACANVANLLLGRAVARRREVAVRLALGAGQGRLARQLIAEALLLVTLGAAAALALATSGYGLVQRYLTGGAAVSGSGVDGRLFAFTAAVALGTAGLIALAPWMQSTGLDLTRALRMTGSTGDVRASRVRSALLGTQAALAMLLLVIAALFVHSLRQVRGLDLGVDRDHTLIATFDAEQVAGGLPRVQRIALYRSLTERVRALPGVEHTALAEMTPYGGGHAVGAHPLSHDPDEYWHLGVMQVPMEVAVDSGYFRTAGATSLRGRDFESTDRPGAPPVTIIDDALAKILFPSGDPLGQCLIIPEPPHNRGGECVTVVGVLPSFRLGESVNRGVLMVYRPLAQSHVALPHMMLIRVRGDASAAVRSVRHAIQSVRPDMPAVSVTAMRDGLDAEYRPWDLAATMFSLFGAVALVIAIVGLYGVVAFAAVQRMSEIAIRRTLGAGARDVLRAVAGPALRTVAVGLAAGTVLVLMAHRWLAPLLYETSARDPYIIGGAAFVLLAAAVAASVVPPLRALRRNPAEILRME